MKRFHLEADVSVSAFAGTASVPQWQMLFPLGVTKHRPDFPKGKATFDAEFLGALADNFKKMAARHKGDKFALQLNYLHPEPGQPVENHRAAGWIEDVSLREDGLYVLVRWTDEAREFIAKDAFRYLSPEFSFDWQDSDTGKRQGPTLWGAALLNSPFLKELPRVAASEQTPPEQSGNEGASMMKALCAALGMPEDSKEEDVLEKCKSLSARLSEFEKAKPEAEEAKAGEQAAVAKLTETQGALVKLAEQNKALEEKLAKLEGEKRTSDVTAFFDRLIKEGRCTPSIRGVMEKYALTAGLDAVRELEKAPPMVVMGEQGVAGESVPEDSAAATKKLSDIADELAKKHGLSATDALRMALRQNKSLADKVAATK